VGESVLASTSAGEWFFVEVGVARSAGEAGVVDSS